MFCDNGSERMCHVEVVVVVVVGVWDNRHTMVCQTPGLASIVYETQQRRGGGAAGMHNKK